MPDKKGKEKYEKLRGENRQLRKLVKQLRKENQKLKEKQAELNYYDPQKFEEELQTVSTPQCPQCKSKNINILEKLRNNIDYYVCNDCESKGRLND